MTWNDLSKRIAQMTIEERNTHASYVNQSLGTDGYPVDNHVVHHVGVFRADQDMQDIRGPLHNCDRIVLKKGDLFLCGLMIRTVTSQDDDVMEGDPTTDCETTDLESMPAWVRQAYQEKPMSKVKPFDIRKNLIRDRILLDLREHGMTQADLAKKMKNSQVPHILAQPELSNLSVLIRIAEAIGVDLSDIHNISG